MVRHFEEPLVAVAPADLRTVLAQWPTGVTVVTTAAGGGWQGMTASSFAGVSLEPPLVLVCLARTAYTHRLLLESRVFGITILAKDQADVGKRFARWDPDAPDRFAGGSWTTSVTGSPVLGDALGWLDCRISSTHDEGDHTVVIGEVLAAGTPRITAPLVYHARTWGQFADLLPDAVQLTAGDPDALTLHVADADAVPAEALRHRHVVVDDAFVVGAAALATAVGALARASAGAVVLADPAGTASPVAVRENCREALLNAGGLPVAVRLSDADGLGLANLLVALKSGVHRVESGAGALAPDRVRHLVARLALPLEEIPA